MIDRPKYTAPTREWEEYVDRFLATYPTAGECSIVQRHLQKRQAICQKRYNGTAQTTVWRDRAYSARRLTEDIIDYKYPNTTSSIFRKAKTKKVKHYYAVIH